MKYDKNINAERYARGSEFEETALEELKRVLEANFIFNYQIVKNVAYRSRNGKGSITISQIDSVLICEYGVFCLEMKNWKGVVTTTNDLDWKVTIDSYVKRYKNPVIQNEKHSAALKILLDNNLSDFKARNIPVYNLVLFSENAILSNDMKDCVMYVKDVPTFVQKNNCRINRTLAFDISRCLSRLSEKNMEEFNRLHKHQIQ